MERRGLRAARRRGAGGVAWGGPRGGVAWRCGGGSASRRHALRLSFTTARAATGAAPRGGLDDAAGAGVAGGAAGRHGADGGRRSGRRAGWRTEQRTSERERKRKNREEDGRPF
jgi:hypothetical protein